MKQTPEIKPPGVIRYNQSSAEPPDCPAPAPVAPGGAVSIPTEGFCEQMEGILDVLTIGDRNGDDWEPAKPVPKGKAQAVAEGKFDPSEPLRNTRHEMFCQLRASGTGQAKAYELAGFAPNDSNASRLTSSEQCKARVRWLMDAASTERTLSRAAALEILSDIAGAQVARHSDRINALRTMGSWCSWETGTEAEQGKAAGVQSIAEQLAAIRNQGR